MQTTQLAKQTLKQLPVAARQLVLPSSNSSLTATTVTPQPASRTIFRRSVQRSINKKKNEKIFHTRERSPGVITPTHSTYEKLTQQPILQRQITVEHPSEEPLNPLRFESTFGLIKKFCIYKMMGSELFINYSLLGMRASYKLLGTKLTNMTIEQTCGSIFTGGVTLEDLLRNQVELEKQNIGTIGMNVVEGLREISEQKLDHFLHFTLDAIDKITKGKEDGHMAVKLTAFVSTEVMEKVSKAQKIFMEQILCTPSDATSSDVLSKEELRKNLASVGIETYSQQDFNALCDQISDVNGKMTTIHRYAGGHLFQLYAEGRTDLQSQIAEKCGDFTSNDFERLDTFYGRIREISTRAQERNCALYVDAEQTFIQPGIESFGQQMTHKFNKGNQVIIMNGYQAYTKRMSHVIPMEIAASQLIGYNLGIKLIRGAYMNEERQIAEKAGIDSPVWDTVEETHQCYNDCVENIVGQMNANDMFFIASHNVDSCTLAKDLAAERGLAKANRVRFGQLRGFSDSLTSQLADEGFSVYKYLPFGPTEEVMPYLVRRGQESRQVLREQKFQNETLKAEIFSRISPF